MTNTIAKTLHKETLTILNQPCSHPHSPRRATYQGHLASYHPSFPLTHTIFNQDAALNNSNPANQGTSPSLLTPTNLHTHSQLKSQCRTFPDGRSNHYFTLRFAIISNHVVLLLPQEGHAHHLGTSWHVGPHDRPCSPADRSVKSPHFYYTSSVSVYYMACTSFYVENLTGYICDEHYMFRNYICLRIQWYTFCDIVTHI